MENLINDDLDLSSSDDETDSEFHNETDIGSQNQNCILMIIKT